MGLLCLLRAKRSGWYLFSTPRTFCWFLHEANHLFTRWVSIDSYGAAELVVGLEVSVLVDTLKPGTLICPAADLLVGLVVREAEAQRPQGLGGVDGHVVQLHGVSLEEVCVSRRVPS